MLYYLFDDWLQPTLPILIFVGKKSPMPPWQQTSQSLSSTMKIKASLQVIIPEQQLSEEALRKLRLVDWLLKVLKHFDNGKTCIISALVYIDRLINLKDDVVCHENLLVVRPTKWLRHPIIIRIYLFLKPPLVECSLGIMHILLN